MEQLPTLAAVALVGALTAPLACKDAATPSADWADACHAASLRHMDCGATLLEASRGERICKEASCLDDVIRADAVDPLMECMQQPCDKDCAAILEESLEPSAAELAVLDASLQHSACKISYAPNRFGRLIKDAIWHQMLPCWQEDSCDAIDKCLDGVQHATLSTCAEPVHLVLAKRPPKPRRDATHFRSATHAFGSPDCRSSCFFSSSSCRDSCRPRTWAPNMRSIQSHCEQRCDFDRFRCESTCRGR